MTLVLTDSVKTVVGKHMPGSNEHQVISADVDSDGWGLHTSELLRMEWAGSLNNLHKPIQKHIVREDCEERGLQAESVVS